MDKPRKLRCWMVQYNLGGLSEPMQLYWHEDANGWYSRNGEFGTQHNAETSADVLPADVDDCNLVQRFFSERQSAVKLYRELSAYRDFIRNHI